MYKRQPPGYVFVPTYTSSGTSIMVSYWLNDTVLVVPVVMPEVSNTNSLDVSTESVKIPSTNVLFLAVCTPSVVRKSVPVEGLTTDMSITSVSYTHLTLPTSDLV